MKYVLIADDDDDVRILLHDALRDYKCSTICVANGKQLYALATSCRDDLCGCVVDYHMPIWGGLESVEMFRGFGVEAPVIYLTGDADAAKELRGAGHEVLEKPVDTIILCKTVRKLFYNGKKKTESNRLRTK